MAGKMKNIIITILLLSPITMFSQASRNLFIPIGNSTDTILSYHHESSFHELATTRFWANPSGQAGNFFRVNNAGDGFRWSPITAGYGLSWSSDQISWTKTLQNNDFLIGKTVGSSDVPIVGVNTDGNVWFKGSAVLGTGLMLFGDSGVEMVLDINNNYVGIGGTPAELFHMKGGEDILRIEDTRSRSSWASLQSSKIQFWNSDPSNNNDQKVAGEISIIGNPSAGGAMDGDMMFRTRNVTGLTLTYNQRVGIGTTAPARTLEVAGEMRLTDTDITGSSSRLLGVQSDGDVDDVVLGSNLSFTADTLNVTATDDQNDTEITITYSPTNFTKVTSLLYGTLQGIDNALGAISDTDDQTAAEVSIADAGGLITATDVEGALQEIAGYDAGDIAITDLAGGFASAAVEGALQELTLQAEISPTDASTISITKYRAFILIDDLEGSTQTHTLSTTNVPNGARVFIKSGAATSVTFSTSSGNFVPLGSTSGSSTIAITGVGELQLIWVSSLSSWFQI